MQVLPIYFPSADEMVRSIVNSDGEVRVAACRVVEVSTKFFVLTMLIVGGLIIFLPLVLTWFIGPSFILVGLVYIVYIGLAGGADAIIIHKSDGATTWDGVYLIQSVKNDARNAVTSYKSLNTLRRAGMERKFGFSLFGGFKFEYADATFNLIGTMSKAKQEIYNNGSVSLREIKGLLAI